MNRQRKHCCFSISSANNVEGNPFNHFEKEKSWNRQGKDRQRHVKNYGVVRMKINPLGAVGKNPKMPILHTILSFIRGLPR